MADNERAARGRAHDDHAGHDHGGHDHGAHDDHAGHDHGGHDHGAHDDHAGHDHGGHDHGAHDDHAGHDHGGHDHGAHDDHAGHDHGGHDHGAHDDHAGHNHGGHDHAGHDHHDHDLREAGRRRLYISLGLIGSYMVVEIIGGLISGSLALLADAAHMFTDAAAIGLALFAMWISSRPASVERTFGYHRTEILAALVNALSLWLIAGWIFLEAYHRLSDPPEVLGMHMLIVGAIGLAINVAVVFILHSSAEHSLNVEAAFWHVVADLLGSIGVVISGLLVWFLDWNLADPIISVLIGLLILASSWSLVQKVFQVLVEGTPRRLDMYQVCHTLEEVPGVTLIHDVHCWTITSGYEALTAHVLLDPSLPKDQVEPALRRLRQIASQEFGISHITLQVEQSIDGCTEDHHVGHLEALQRTSGRRSLMPF